MFEASQQSEQSSKSSWLIAILIIVVLAVVGTLAYRNSKSSTKTEAPAAAAPKATAQSNADAVKDLHIVNAKMDKDYTGTTAVWSVDLKNESSTFTYSQIAYETTYAGADNSILAQNHGTMALSLAPGDEESTQFRDALYPSGTAWFKFRVTGAASSR
ncbi:MAG TPA: hypothetical protein VJO53_03545 [Candidatus Acidoferrales bacterium]|nr:hypothetical protein [Candidatus Acidoferrales bacterium]